MWTTEQYFSHTSARKIKLMTKNKIFFVTVLLLGVFHYTLAQSVQKTIKRLPDTGQTTSYTTTPGEDADYNINPPFFINNSNGNTAADKNERKDLPAQPRGICSG